MRSSRGNDAVSDIRIPGPTHEGGRHPRGVPESSARGVEEDQTSNAEQVGDLNLTRKGDTGKCHFCGVEKCDTGVLPAPGENIVTAVRSGSVIDKRKYPT